MSEIHTLLAALGELGALADADEHSAPLAEVVDVALDVEEIAGGGESEDTLLEMEEAA